VVEPPLPQPAASDSVTITASAVMRGNLMCPPWLRCHPPGHLNA
jgi:hypothetical protein